MPTARIQLPDGRIGRFEVPEGTTPDQVEAFARNSMAVGGGVNEGIAAAPEPVAANPVQAQQQAMPSIGRTVLDQGLQGATFGFADEVTDRLGAGLAAMSRPELTYKDALSQAREMTRNDLKNQLEQRPAASIASQLGGGLFTGVAGATTKAGSALANYVRNGNLAARIAKGAAAGATSGGLYGAGSAEDGQRLQGLEQGAITGGVIGGAIPAIGAGLSQVKGAIVPEVEATTRKLAERARELGIPLRLDQVSPTRARNTVQKISQEIPFSGVDDFENVQRQSFTKAVAKTIGQDADDLSPVTVKKFLKDSGDKFDSLLKGKTITFNTLDKQALDKIAIDAGDTITEDLAKVVRNNVDKLAKDINPDGTIAGDKLASFRSQLIKRIPKAQGGSKEFLSDLIDVVDGVVTDHTQPQDLEILKEARRQWRNFKTIEPLLEKSTDGQVNPTELLNRVKSSPYIKASRASVGEDELVDLARIGKEFLPKKGGSDTMQKTAGLLGTGGFLTLLATNPTLAVALGAKAGAGMLANRGLQKVNSSQPLVEYALRSSSKVPNKLIGNINKVPVTGGTSSNIYQSLEK